MAVSSSIFLSFPSMSKMPPQRVLAIQQCFNLVCSYHGGKCTKRDEGRAQGTKKLGRSKKQGETKPKKKVCRVKSAKSPAPGGTSCEFCGYICGMREPAYPHFVLADGEYCQLVDGKLIIGKRDLPPVLPPVIGTPDYVVLGLQLAGLLLLGFFLGMTIVAKYYVVTVTLAILFLTLAGSVYKMAGYTSTRAIIVADIVGVDYKKKLFGYDYFVVHYAGPKGKDCKRRLTIYDSSKCLEQALDLMKELGFLKA